MQMISLTFILNRIWVHKVKFSPSSGNNLTRQIAAAAIRGAPCEMRRIPPQNKGKKMEGGD